MSKYIRYANIPQIAIDDIIYCVEHDEGGWVISSNKDDPDGGFTFAGVIASHWGTYYFTTILSGGVPYTLKMATIWFNGLDIVSRKMAAIEIYYNEFYLPLKATLKVTEELHPYEFSCAVNRGVANTELVAKIAANAGEAMYETVFLREWMRQYVNLVQANSAAWRAYSINPKVFNKPATLRSVNLEGWFNRVERYRTVESELVR